MTALFSAEWMNKFQAAWNIEPELAGELAKIGFNSVIGYWRDHSSRVLPLWARFK